MGQNKFPKTTYLDCFEIIDFIFKNEYGSYKGAFFLMVDLFKKTFFLFYEWIQKFLFFFLFLFSAKVKQGKFLHFVELRDPVKFKSNVEKAYKKYYSLQSEYPQLQIYWFHVSSAGEMEQAIPVARKLNEKLDVRFFVTYYSPSAEPFLKNFPSMIGSSGLPIDVRSLYTYLFKKIPIKKMFFVRYDIWPSLFYSCRENNIEMNLLSASRLKTKTGIKRYISEKWNQNFYRYFSNIFAVTNDDVSFFKKYIAEDHVYLAGDAKWARAFERAHEKTKIKKAPGFSCFVNFCHRKKKEFYFKNIVFGSPHKEEHEVVLRLAPFKDKVFIIYVPHDVTERSCKNIFNELASVGFDPVFYTDLVQKIESKEDILQKNVVVVNKMGFLAEIYHLADVAVIGGGFDGQIHNVLEAAAHGIPVLFGSRFSRAREAQTLILAEAALSFESPDKLFQFLSCWVSLDGKANDSTLRLAHAQSSAVKLFQNVLDTSEVVLNAFIK